MLDTAAARNLHADNGHALDVVAADDFGQLFGVVDAVKLWTSDQSYFTMDKVLMEAAVCVSGTVGSDQKFGTSWTERLLGCFLNAHKQRIQKNCHV